ncbi:hypothetical protein [Antribacter gilvus]|uniref:hypothetical protein n=1 Tax=Antribacter gilvus TaxID=2304675 RepID=UPI000F7B4693|nr:hypothetical protein [Antribacter gilvus]
MTRRRTAARAAALALLTTATLAGCAEPDDEIYVTTVTDSHGRACTFVYTARDGASWTDARDVDVSQLDCEYPPAGKEPGESTTERLDAG